MKRPRPRVAVVGGGPAGSTLALLLAERRIDVTLYTGGGYARPCGEAVLNPLFGWLVRPPAEVGECISSSSIGAVWSAAFCYAGPGGVLDCRWLGERVAPYGIVVDKPRFIRCLREKAAAAGAEVVEARAESGELRLRDYDVIVDARGAAGGLRPYDTLVAARWYVDSCDACRRGAAVFVFGDFPGYAWAFTHGDRFNVGIGFRAEWAARQGLRLHDYLRMASRMLGFEPAAAAKEAASAIALREPRMPVKTARGALGALYLAVGEAGGFIVPYSGEGIRPAIESAVAAAAGIAEGDWRLYERLVRHYRSLHRSYRLLLRLTGGGVRLGRLAPRIADERLVSEAHRLTPPRMLMRLLRGLLRRG